MAVTPSSFFTKMPVLIAVLVIFLVGVGAGVFYYFQSTGKTSILGENTKNSDQEAQQLVEQVGKIYELPTGEVPTVATVSDVTKLAGQEFFKSAQNGDKVLIYTKAKKAILYRPSINKVVEVGPVNIDENTGKDQSAATDSAKASPTGSITPTPAGPVTIALFNGTQTSGLARRFETILKEQDDLESRVTSRANATNDYRQSLVVDLTGGKQKETVAKLAKLIKGSKTATTLPAGEAQPAGTDILIILGDDFAGASQ